MHLITFCLWLQCLSGGCEDKRLQVGSFARKTGASPTDWMGSLCEAGTMRILLIAADPLVRAGLATLFIDQPAVEVVGQLSPLDDVPAGVAAYRPELLVWDMGWQEERIIERLAELIDTLPPSLLLVPDEATARASWSIGARAILGREANGETIVAAASALLQGLIVIDPAFASSLPINIAQSEPPPPEPLTPRELEVLRGLAEGLSNKELARRLGISEHTVKFHLNALMGKLGAQSRTEAVVRATRAGLIFL